MQALTDMQKAFVLAFTTEPGAIGNASEAAKRAGYSVKSAHEIGRQLLEKPHVKAAIDDANRAQIGHSLATKAVDVLRRLIDDETIHPKVRLDAAKTVLDRSGYATARTVEPEVPPEKELVDYSIDELRAIIADAKAASEAEEEEREANTVVDLEGLAAASARTRRH